MNPHRQPLIATDETRIAFKLMQITFTQDSARTGNLIMHRLFCEGWETLEPLQYAQCGHYYTTLYFPVTSE